MKGGLALTTLEEAAAEIDDEVVALIVSERQQDYGATAKEMGENDRFRSLPDRLGI